MRAKLATFVAVLMLCGCRRHGLTDEALSGTWSWADGGAGGALVLASDGTFVSRSTNRWATGSKVFAYAGTWRLSGGVVTSTYTNTSEPKVCPVGTVDVWRITRLTKDEFAWEGLDRLKGQSNTLMRVK